MSMRLWDRIFDVAASRLGSCIVFIDHDAIARVLDLERRALVSSFPVSWDNGGRRVAVNERGDLCVTGTYGRGGLAAYALPGGELRWQQRSFRRVQALVFDERRGTCIVIRESAKLLVLDPDTGVPQRELQRARWLVPSPHDDLCLIDRRVLSLAEDCGEQTRFTIPRATFAPLAAAFSPTTVFVSESAGPLRAFDLSSGRERWTIRKPGEHYLRLAHSLEHDMLCGFRWPYEKGGDTHLDCIECDTGRILSSHCLGPCGSGGVFVKDATRAVLFSGHLIDTLSGEVLCEMRADVGP